MSNADFFQNLHELSEKYKGKTVEELMNLLDIDSKQINKSIGEQIVVKMFASESKIQNIELFRKTRIIRKTLTLKSNGKKKEDMKFFTINFDEFNNKNIEFRDSQIYDYFANNRFLCIIFQMPHKDAKMIENKFLGFKIIDFDEKFIENDVKVTWDRIKDLIVNNKLKDEIKLDKNGNPIINKTGIIRSAPNFPKSSEGNVFLRGTGSTSQYKPLTINGINMYYQQIWVKGNYIVEKLNEKDYI